MKKLFLEMLKQAIEKKVLNNQADVINVDLAFENDNIVNMFFDWQEKTNHLQIDLYLENPAMKQEFVLQVGYAGATYACNTFEQILKDVEEVINNERV